MSNHNLKLRERGDTIVEVLIAVAVVSSVLGVTFATMNRNLTTMRDNQEHTQASKIAQSQAEALVNMWNADSSLITTLGGSGFCIPMNPAPAAAPATINAGASPTTDPNVDVFANYAAAGCQTADTIFNYGIKRNGKNAYVITVRWIKFNSSTRNERVIVYKPN